MSDKCNSSACLSVPDSEKFHAKASSTNFQFPLKVDMNYLDGSHVQLKPELVSAYIKIIQKDKTFIYQNRMPLRLQTSLQFLVI